MDVPLDINHPAMGYLKKMETAILFFCENRAQTARAPSALGRLHNPCPPWMGLFESGSKMFQKHWIILCSTIQYIVDDHNPIGLWYIYLHLGDF
jgi:hypothetical protein